MTPNKFKLIGIKKLLLPVKRLDLLRSGGPTRALFGFLPGNSGKEGGQDLAAFLKRVPLFEDLGLGISGGWPGSSMNETTGMVSTSSSKGNPAQPCLSSAPVPLRS